MVSRMCICDAHSCRAWGWYACARAREKEAWAGLVGARESLYLKDFGDPAEPVDDDEHVGLLNDLLGKNGANRVNLKQDLLKPQLVSLLSSAIKRLPSV